jgi:hypothetical protein
MQITLSDNATRFLNKILPTLLLRADNADFLPDAEAVAEIIKTLKPVAGEAPTDAPANV